MLETKSPFDRREKGEAYWFIGDDGLLCGTGERSWCIDSLHHRILWRFSEENGGAGVCSICYDNQTGDWKTIVKTGNISMFGPTFCCKKVASRAIEVAKEWLSYNGLAPKDVFF